MNLTVRLFVLALLAAAPAVAVALAQVPQIRDRDAAACDGLRKRIREFYRAYAALIAADAGGEVVCSSIGPGPPIGDRAYFRMAVQSGHFAIGEYVFGRGTQTHAIHFAYPLRRSDGAIDGVIAAALDLNWFADRLREKLPQDAVLNVADRNGTILVRIPDNDRWR